MKDKKGFTLIELLAVIVILAIIALIAVPIILNMINNARKSAAVDATYGYVEAIEHNVGLSDIGTTGYDIDISDGTYTVAQINSKNIKIKGKKPTKGNVTLATRKVSHARLVFNGYWVEYNGKEAEVTGKYTPGKATITFKNGETTIDTRQVNEGSTIGSFPNITLEENETLVGWYSESAFTNKVETTTEVNDDMTVYVKINRPKTCNDFASDSWSTIVQNTYPVGCEKEITMDVNEDGTNETYHLVIVNNTTPEECNSTNFSQSACGMVLQFKELLNITNNDDKKMNLNNTNVGGWPASKMYTYLNTTIYNKLPSDLKSVIINTKTVSGNGNGDNDNNNFVSDDKLYLLSTKELGYDVGNEDSARDETRKLDYYLEGKKAAQGNIRIKYKYGTTTTDEWWLRSAQYSVNNDSIFLFVYSNGNVLSSYGTAAQLKGVAPAFRIGS